MFSPDDILVAFGGAIKAVAGKPEGTVGGYLVTYTDATKKDLSGEYFTPETYFGPHKGNGMDCMVHHGIPLHPELAALAKEKKFLPPIKVTEDELGLFAEVTLDLADKYQEAVYKLVNDGALGWSSGSAPHMADVDSNGEIKSWVIIEGSLTPTPCSPEQTNRVMPLKSFLEIQTMGAATAKATTTAPAPAVATPATPVAVKAEHFSDYLEGNMTISALDSLWWALNSKGWNAVTSVEGGSATVAEAAESLKPVLTEFSEYYIKIFVSLMSMKEGAEESTGAEGEPATDDAVSIKSFMKLYPTTESFIEAMTKASKVLSKKNVERATAIMKSAQEMLDDHGSKDAAATATKNADAVQLEMLATLKSINERMAAPPQASEPAPAAVPPAPVKTSPAATKTARRAVVTVKPKTKKVPFTATKLNELVASVS